MKRRLLESCGLLIAIIFVSAQPLHAGDRKSSGREIQESKLDLFASSSKSRAILVSGRPEPGPAGGRLFEDSNSLLASKRLGGHEQRENSGEPKREHKSLTLLHFNSKLGEVKVQPVFGKVTGAQFSLGF